MRKKKKKDLIIYTHTNVCTEKREGKYQNIVVVLSGEIIGLDWWDFW